MNQNVRLISFALLGVVASACGQGDESGGQIAQAIDGAPTRDGAGAAAARERATEGGRAWSGPADVLAGESSDEELDPIEACVAAACPGLSGPEFAACAINSCQSQIFNVSSPCLGCLADNQNTSIEVIVAICGSDPPPPPPTAACTVEEFTPLEVCAIEHCDGLSGGPLVSCALQFCSSEFGGLSAECTSCASQHVGEGIEGVIDACVAVDPPPPPPLGCTGDEIDLLAACVLMQCGKLKGSQLISCTLAYCNPVLGSVSSECANCMVQNAEGALPGVIAACGPEAEPPPPAACTPDEIGPIETCVTAACPGLSGSELLTCALNFCQGEIVSVSSVCLNCLSAHQDGTIEEIVEACGG
jgi:hypothetical protein